MSTADSVDPDDLQWPALLDAQAQLQAMHEAWWRVNDGLRLLRGNDADEVQAIAEVHADLDTLAQQLRRVQKGVQGLVDQARRRSDAAAMQALAPSADQAAAVRERLAQIDVNLSTLYRQLQPLCLHSAAPLAQEAQAGSTGNQPPLWNAEVRVDLDYMIGETHPQFDEHSNNILACQEAIFWKVNARGLKENTHPDSTEQDNWLDHPHPWMTRQGWLTHDVLEHNYGQHPHYGVAALLHTQTVWVEVHTVRSYAYDLQTGRFAAPESDA